jgi:plasmid stabilization system protein ParE
VDLLSRFPRMGIAISRRSRVRNLVHSQVVVYYMLLEDKRAVEILQICRGSRQAP